MGRYLEFEMLGKRFGHWTVVERAGNASNGAPQWRSVCDCGKSCLVGGWDLRNGKTTQCRTCAVRSRPSAGSIKRMLLHNARARAKASNLPCDITLSDIEVPDVCPLLGIPIYQSGKVTANSPTLDRIIPARGYVKRNIAVISFKANSIKSNATPAELRTVSENLERLIIARGLLTSD